MAETRRYAIYDLCPAIFTTFEGWCLFVDEVGWVRTNPADIATKARAVSKAEFDKEFPNLPPLPPEAFGPIEIIEDE